MLIYGKHRVLISDNDNANDVALRCRSAAESSAIGVVSETAATAAATARAATVRQRHAIVFIDNDWLLPLLFDCCWRR